MKGQRGSIRKKYCIPWWILDAGFHRFRPILKRLSNHLIRRFPRLEPAGLAKMGTGDLYSPLSAGK